MSQTDLLESIGLKFTKDIKSGQIIDWTQLDKE
jgi:hypothetical protein